MKENFPLLMTEFTKGESQEGVAIYRDPDGRGIAGGLACHIAMK